MSTFLAINVHWEGEATFSGRLPQQGTNREWPPAPSRIFAALVAGAAASLDAKKCFDTLEVLESLPAPIIVAGEAFDAIDPLHYTPKVNKYPFPDWFFENRSKPKSAKMEDLKGCLRISDWHELRAFSEHVSYGKRLNGARTVSSPDLSYLVSLDSLSPKEQLQLCAILDQAAEGIPYFGCSNDLVTVVVEFFEGDLASFDNQGRRLYIPSLSSTGLKLRGWAPGYLQSLKSRHEERTTEGLVDSGAPDLQSPDIHYVSINNHDCDPFFIFAVEPSVRAHSCARYLKEISDRTDCSVTPLVFGDDLHGDGRLMGVMVQAKSFEEVILRTQELLPLEWVVEPSDYKQSLDPRNIFLSDHLWRSVTPVRSYNKLDYAHAHILMELRDKTGLDVPEINILEIKPAPLSQGSGRAPKVGPSQFLTPGFVDWHIHVKFEFPITGPITVGFDTSVGCGVLTQASSNGGHNA